MCGIAGFLNLDGGPASSSWLKAMTDSIAHRGPDGDGHYIDGPVGLGHRRLSIIDLEAGRQPLSNEDGTVWITFNGEIYNYQELRQRLHGLGHRFRTDSDTETIVHAYEQWGVECLQQLRGMFAFAIWDARSRRLFLARDRIGIKPLIYWKGRSCLAFASEMQALQAVPGFPNEISLESVDLFLHYQYIPAPRTIYRDVHKLEPAHFIVFAADGSTAGPQRYWKLRMGQAQTHSPEQWREKLEDSLRETVRAHLVSDVPFGAFLSGGIDSSLVVAGMSDILDQPVRAFCIGHSRPDFDERPWARHVAQTCGVEFIEQVIDEDSLELVPALVRHYGEPFADSSALPTYYVSRLAAEHVKMVLSGDGGDELFAGYFGYFAILWDHRQPASPWLRVKNQLANAARAARLWPPIPTAADSKYRRTTPMEAHDRRRLWRAEHHAVLNQTRRQFDDRLDSARHSTLLDTLQAFDLENYIPYDNLAKVDVASMFHGLEVRVPLLDHVFMETACSLPPELRMSGLDQRGELTTPPDQVTGKLLWKQMAESRFGHDFVYRQKRGFEVPVQHWFQGEHAAELREQILDSSLPLADWFDPAALARVVSESGESKLQAWNGWSLLILAEWCRQRTPARQSKRSA